MPGLTALAVAGAVASVIGAYYYLNIVKVMYLDEAGRPLALQRQPGQHGRRWGWQHSSWRRAGCRCRSSRASAFRKRAMAAAQSLTK